MVDFGYILKQLRTESKITQKDLADRIGVTKSVISYYELLERSPSPEVLIKLAAIFNVTTDYLLGIDKKHTQTLDVSGLTDDDVQFLRLAIELLKKKNAR